MKKEDILKILRQVSLNLQTNQNGYFSVSYLGKALIQKGFNYQTNGYKKLLDLLNDFSSDIEISYDEVPSKLPFAKFLKNEISDTEEVDQEPVVKIRNLDFDGWGIIFNSAAKLRKLKEIALQEDWSYGDDEDETNPILENYLLFTFKRLQNEKEKIFSNEQYAVFDTGLVNKRYDAIYAIFERNSTPKKENRK